MRWIDQIMYYISLPKDKIMKCIPLLLIVLLMFSMSFSQTKTTADIFANEKISKYLVSQLGKDPSKDIVKFLKNNFKEYEREVYTNNEGLKYAKIYTNHKNSSPWQSIEVQNWYEKVYTGVNIFNKNQTLFGKRSQEEILKELKKIDNVYSAINPQNEKEILCWVVLDDNLYQKVNLRFRYNNGNKLNNINIYNSQNNITEEFRITKSLHEGNFSIFSYSDNNPYLNVNSDDSSHFYFRLPNKHFVNCFDVKLIDGKPEGVADARKNGKCNKCGWSNRYRNKDFNYSTWIDSIKYESGNPVYLYGFKEYSPKGHEGKITYSGTPDNLYEKIDSIFQYQENLRKKGHLPEQIKEKEDKWKNRKTVAEIKWIDDNTFDVKDYLVNEKYNIYYSGKVNENFKIKPDNIVFKKKYIIKDLGENPFYCFIKIPKKGEKIIVEPQKTYKVYASESCNENDLIYTGTLTKSYSFNTGVISKKALASMGYLIKSTVKNGEAKASYTNPDVYFKLKTRKSDMVAREAQVVTGCIFLNNDVYVKKYEYTGKVNSSFKPNDKEALITKTIYFDNASKYLYTKANFSSGNPKIIPQYNKLYTDKGLTDEAVNEPLDLSFDAKQEYPIIKLEEDLYLKANIRYNKLNDYKQMILPKNKLIVSNFESVFLVEELINQVYGNYIKAEKRSLKLYDTNDIFTSYAPVGEKVEVITYKSISSNFQGQEPISKSIGPFKRAYSKYLVIDGDHKYYTYANNTWNKQEDVEVMDGRASEKNFLFALDGEKTAKLIVAFESRKMYLENPTYRENMDRLSSGSSYNNNKEINDIFRGSNQGPTKDCPICNGTGKGFRKEKISSGCQTVYYDAQMNKLSYNDRMVYGKEPYYKRYECDEKYVDVPTRCKKCSGSGKVSY